MNNKAQRRSVTATLGLDKQLLLQMYDHMLRSRVLEERLIKIYKTGDAFFWIGGPGEEAFGVALGMLVDKGQGHNHDWLHLHYRCTPTLVAMGMPMIDSIRLIMNRATDTHTGGRNFSNHYCIPQWNVLPVSSPIEVQYAIAIGTGIAQSRRKQSTGITIVTGGDAGTAEGEFASCLVWASRPVNPLPMLITVQNNKWGISTEYDGQHGEKKISDRGKAFGMKTVTFDGNDPIESYFVLQESFQYIREKRRPVLAEAILSRLYGHSSADGANMRVDEKDCLPPFEKKLVDAGCMTMKQVKELRDNYDKESRKIADQVREEPGPTADSLWQHTFVDSENADWRKF